jgi:mannose-6-phosphate isomerase-like protein (cupin superfamily)
MSSADLPTKWISAVPDVTATDGSEVRILCELSRGGMAMFTLMPGAVSKAVAHRTVEEIWCVIRGRGRIWRRLGDQEEMADLVPGMSVAISTGTHFQFRNDGAQPLDIIGATMPPWPGDGEAYVVDGRWEPTV